MSYAKLQMVVLILFALLSIGAGTGWLVNRATGSEGSGAGAQAVPAVAPKPVNATVAEAPPAVAVGKEERDALVTGNTAFALKMYGELSAKEGNLFFSPYSISSALGMTYAGARGNAAREIKDALSFGLEQDKLHAAFKALKDELAASTRKSGQKLNIANGLCLTGGDARDEFKALIRDRYDAEIFAGDLDKINGWVKKKTEGKIEKILEELHPLTVCVLLNAVYFKGVWANQFKKSDTRELPFKLSATNQVRVPQMYQKGNFKLLELNGFQAACLPYKGGTMAMIVLLSDAVDGLPELEKQLNAQNLSQWLVGLDKTMAGEIDLYLPRFRLETKYDLIPPFRNLGMKDAFTDTAGSFSGINEIITKINQIRHKAFCEVNEEGTEAAAATAVEAVTMGLFGTPTFRADHPFIYLIRDNETGSILFMGRMMNPKG